MGADDAQGARKERKDAGCGPERRQGSRATFAPFAWVSFRCTVAGRESAPGRYACHAAAAEG